MLDLERSTQAVFVMTPLISAPLWTASHPHPQSPTLESNKSCVCVCVCVCVCLCVCVCVCLCVCVFVFILPLCFGLCAGKSSIIGIAFHSSITFPSARIPRSRKMYLLYVEFFCARQASVWLECQLSLTRGRVLARVLCDVSHSSGIAWLQMPLNAASKPASLNVSLHTFWRYPPTPLPLPPTPPPPPSPLQLSMFFQFTFALVSSPPRCVLFSAVHRVLWQRLLAGPGLSTAQLWPLPGPQHRRSMESMVKDRNMEAEESAWCIVYQLGTAVLSEPELPVFY